MTKTVVYALTPTGAGLGKSLADQTEGELFLPAHLANNFGAKPFDSLSDAVSMNFSLYPRQIFIAAAGIVVRVIAPHLTSKDKDPAVVFLDQEGKHVISLLSGHLGGANDLAHKVALLTGGDAIITTATDTAGLPAIDMLAKEKGLAICNRNAVKSINMAILNGDPVQVYDPGDRLGLEGQKGAGFNVKRVIEENKWTKETAGVWVTWKSKAPVCRINQLILCPRCLIAGVGCNRGTEAREILELISTTFKDNDLCVKSIKYISTIEDKKDEKGILDAARILGVPIFFASPLEINTIKVPNPSSIVKKHMGVSSVCEATALLKSTKKKLLVPKTKGLNVTLAVALED